MERLRAGEVVVIQSGIGESGGLVRAKVLVDAPAEIVWSVVGSCEHAMRYLHGMEECEVVVDEPRRALTHHVVDPGWLAPKADYWFETLREPYRRMDIRLTGGNLKHLEGYWQFVPMDGGLLMEHEVDLRPSIPAPRWLVRRKLKQDLPGMMTCIRGLAEEIAGVTTKESGVQDDLASCQHTGEPSGP